MNPYVLVLVLGIMVIIFGSIFGSKMVKDYMVYKDRMHKPRRATIQTWQTSGCTAASCSLTKRKWPNQAVIFCV